MYLIKVHREREGDLPAYPDSVLDADVERVKIAACARLDGAQAREVEQLRPRWAHIYLINDQGPHMLISRLQATPQGAIELMDRPI
jgi:hypothetical protein